MTDALNWLFSTILLLVSIGVMVFMTVVVFSFFKEAVAMMLGGLATIAGFVLTLAISLGLFLAVCRVALWGFAIL